MTARSRAKKIKSKVEGQGHKIIWKVTKCVAAYVEGLHVDMTAQAYVFHLLFTPITPCSVYDQHICLCVDTQEALLWQRDRATRLSVEILQLQNIAIVWHYLRDPTFSRFYTLPKCDRHTHTDGRTDTRRRHVLYLA